MRPIGAPPVLCRQNQKNRPVVNYAGRFLRFWGILKKMKARSATGIVDRAFSPYPMGPDSLAAASGDL